MEDDIEQQISGVAALDEPARRALYRYVSSQGEEVGRDEAARALGISRALAAFHLDKLVEEGLLETSYRRLTGRSGPGAGRPSKLYRRSSRQIQVSFPPRSYELAAKLFASALSTESSPSTIAALEEIAHDFGVALGSEARRLAGPNPDPTQLMDAACSLLEAYGFEPYQDDDGTVHLRNCPFHALANDYRTLVCGMNLSLLRGVVAGLGADSIEAVLDPQPGMCCVTLQWR